MTLIVQDDTGTVVNANGYISRAYFLSYHSDIGTKITVDDEIVLVAEAGFSNEQIDAAIVDASNYIDILNTYKGDKLADGQTTEFPRECLYDVKGNLVEGIFLKLKKATAEYALFSIQNVLRFVPTVDASGQQITAKREKVGPIEEETQYAAGGYTYFRSFPMADSYLREFRYGITARTVRV